ncbi:hypothetical protein GW17_00060845 [Ensete ventricosum]|nr:hypothetical protein GW17_00060845 [Ensete ventricosum]
MGDLVLKKAEANDPIHSRRKLTPRWEGLYRVVRAIRDGTYTLAKMDGKILPRTWHPINVPLQLLCTELGGRDQILVGMMLEFFVGSPKHQDSLVLTLDQTTRIMDLVGESTNEMKPLRRKGRKAQKKKRIRNERRVAYPDSRLADPIHELLKEHLYT